MKTWLKLLIAAIILFSGTVIFVYFFIYNKAHKDYDAAKAEYRLSAKALYDAYLQDSATSNITYNGKVLEVEGTIDTVENHADTLIVAVFVFDQGMFGPQGVRCSFLPQYTEDAKMLKNNTAMRIKGVCQGFNDTDVIIESASLVEEKQ